MRLDRMALDMSARHAARAAALALLNDARNAHASVEDSRSEKTLHEFRVALRRLRCWLRAYRPDLDDSLSRRALRRLRKSARATGASRDLDAQRLWIESQLADMPARRRSGGRWLLEWLDEHRPATDAELLEAGDSFTKAVDELVRDLGRLTLRLDATARERTLGNVTADAIVERSAKLAIRLSEVGSVADIDAAHRARLAGKRLRYLLEPLEDVIAGSGDAVEALKQLQDVLGELQDAEVLGDKVAEAIGSVAKRRDRRMIEAVLRGDSVASARRAARRHDPRSGLLELAHRLRARSERAFAQLEDSWLREGVDRFVDEVRLIAQQLAEPEASEAPPTPRVDQRRASAELNLVR